MRTRTIPGTDLTVSHIGYGCAMTGEYWDRERMTTGVNAAIDLGISLFDLSDNYGSGEAETTLGETLRRSANLRDRIVIQSKVGTGRNHLIDTSAQHIVSALEGILRRLRIEQLDVLLLHYADALVEPDEVAHAFDSLFSQGKVRYFGTSNHTPTQIDLLKTAVSQPLLINQVRLGLGFPQLLLENFSNTFVLNAPVVGTGTIDYCRIHRMHIQAYSPLRGRFLAPNPNDTAPVKETHQLIKALATNKDTSLSAISLSWLLRHPAQITPIVGTTDPAHLAEACQAEAISMDRDQWYSLFFASAKMSDQR